MTLGRATAFATVLGASIVGCSPTRAAPVESVRVIKKLILDICQCLPFVCGRVAWVKDPNLRQLDCGRTIVWGLSPCGPETRDNGSIYDTTNGNSYRLNATLTSDGRLRAQIFRSIPLFGKMVRLRKVSSRLQPGWC